MNQASSSAERHDLRQCRKLQPNIIPASHQQRSLADLGRWYRSGVLPKGGILSLPTGAGKTFTALHFLCTGPLSDGHKVLWLAHTHHLLDQAAAAFTSNVLHHIREPRETLTVRKVSGAHGHYRAHEIRPTDDVVVATLYTLARAYQRGLESVKAFLASAAQKLIVVFDEAHHAPAPSFRALLQSLRTEHDATLLGLTATPTYTDVSQRGWLGELFPQGVVSKAGRNELMASGVLAKPIFEPHKTGFKPDFDEREYRKWTLGPFGDLPVPMVDQLARSSHRNEAIATTYADNRDRYGKTIIFADRWYQCEAIAVALEKRGVRAGSVYSHVDASLAFDQRRARDKGENDQVIDRFKRGELDVILNVRMLTEGTDIPQVQSVFLTRETTSQILLTQMIGRALRGPKFGGTAEANIVLFMDDWQQAIRFADPEDLGGSTTARETPRSARPPLQLISIELVRRLALSLDGGAAVASRPYSLYMPVGWYKSVYEVHVDDSDDMVLQEHLVLVFDGERDGFVAAMSELLDTPEAEHEDALFEAYRARLEDLRRSHLGGSWRDPEEVLFDLFRLARHCAQAETAPEFFPFEAREQHDLDALFQQIATRDLRRSEEREFLAGEYERKDRYWRVFYPRLDQFVGAFLTREQCGQRPATVTPSYLPPPADREPTLEEKAQVRVRDGHRCLACGAERTLQIDHAWPSSRGGPNTQDNLQTLCRECNIYKGERTIRFTTQRTVLTSALEALPFIAKSRGSGKEIYWEQLLRRSINFAYQCEAVESVDIGGRGTRYYNWTVRLYSGNPLKFMAPHVDQLYAEIQALRERVGKPPLQSITFTAPDQPPIQTPRSG